MPAPNRVPIMVASLVALVIGLGAGLLLHDDALPPAPTSTTTTTVPKPIPPSPVPAGDLQPPLEDGKPDTLRDETPSDVPAEELERGKEETRARAREELEDPSPVGGAQNYSCREAFEPSIYSSRGGLKPTMQVLHYTVSPNRPGWDDVMGIHAYFLRTQIASAHRIIDFDGNCLAEVPESMKAWTQGAANPRSISYEIIATGRETKADWLAAPLLRDGILAAIVRDSARRHGIPLRRVDPAGCVFPPGITMHAEIQCGNTHTDTNPHFPWPEFMKQVQSVPGSIKANRWCHSLRIVRARARKYGSTVARRTRARKLKALLKRERYTCA